MEVDKDPVQMKRETIEIEGGRKLYKYEFEIEGNDAPTEAAKEPTGTLKPSESEAK